MPSARVRPWIAAALFYFALVLTFTWPLAASLSSVVPHDLGDPLENTWILWWNAHAVPLTARWWDAPIFWPAPGALALSEHLLGVSVFTTPLQWLGASPAAAYNVCFLFSFPLCSLAAHALVFTIARRHDAGVIAGLIFGFNPYRIAQAPHLQMLAAWWMPIALLALHQYIHHRQRRWLLLFAVAWLLQSLSNGYFLLFFPVLIAFWIGWFVRDWQALVEILVTWFVASVPLVPFVWKYLQMHALFNLRRDFMEIAAFGGDIASFLDTAPGLMMISKVSAFHKPEGELFPGFTGPVLVASAIAAYLWTAPPRRTSKRIAALVVMSCAFAAIAASVAMIGPWTFSAGGVTLVSARMVAKPLTIALVLLMPAIAFDPRVVGAFRRQSAMAFFVIGAAITALLSLGPEPRFLGAPFMYRAPYWWLLSVPGFDALRVPARFEMLTVLCLSAAAGLAFARLTFQSRIRTARLTFAAIATGIVVESAFHMPLPHRPAVLRAIEWAPPGAALEIPLGDTEHDTPAMYRSMFHRRPLLNGASGFSPPHYQILGIALDDEDEGALDEIASAPLVVAIDVSRELGMRWVEMLARRPGARRLAFEAGHATFWIPATVRNPEATLGRKLAVESVSADRLQADTRRMTDGNLDSFWTTGRPQRGGETVTIDLGAAQTVSALTLSLGRYVGDFPRRLTIDASGDGATWKTCWSGRPARLALAAAIRDPHVVPLTFALASVRARWIRLRQTGSDLVNAWSVPELAVFGR